VVAATEGERSTRTRAAHDDQVGEPHRAGRHTRAVSWCGDDDGAPEQGRCAERVVVGERPSIDLEGDVIRRRVPVSVLAQDLAQVVAEVAEGRLRRRVDEQLQRSWDRVESAVDEAEA
jgi:hypothetical protein